MASKFGFASFKKEFAEHAGKMIQSYQNLETNKKKKKQHELGTFKNEQDQEVCNWLLHYLYTFHIYNSKQNLHALRGVEQLQRYDFGHQYRLEEKLREINSCISNAIVNMGKIINDRLTDIRHEIHAQFEEIAALRQDIGNMRNTIQSLDREIDNIRNHLERTIDQINNTIRNAQRDIISQVDNRFYNMTTSVNNLRHQVESQLQGLNSRISDNVASFNRSLSDLGDTMGNLPSYQRSYSSPTIGAGNLDVSDVVEQTIQRIKSRLG